MHIDDPDTSIETLNQLDFFEIRDYEIEDIIYSSTSSSVYSYKHKQNSSQKVAVKEIRLKDIEIDSLFKHFDHLQKLKNQPHPNIIEVKGFCLMRKRKFAGEDLSALIVMELATQSLADWIQSKIINSPSPIQQSKEPLFLFMGGNNNNNNNNISDESKSNNSNKDNNRNSNNNNNNSDNTQNSNNNSNSGNSNNSNNENSNENINNNNRKNEAKNINNNILINNEIIANSNNNNNNYNNNINLLNNQLQQQQQNPQINQQQIDQPQIPIISIQQQPPNNQDPIMQQQQILQQQQIQQQQSPPFPQQKSPPFSPITKRERIPSKKSRKLEEDIYFSTEQVHQFIWQMVCALEYLQTRHQTAHQDLKPENILVSADLQTFKLGDMDEVKFQGSQKTHLRQICIGTPEYQAPEIQKAIKQVKSMARYNPYKADVYAFGLCLLFMTTFTQFSLSDRNAYYKDKVLYEKTLKALRKTVKVRYSRVVSKLLKCMLEPDPFKRVDFKQLKKIVRENLFAQSPRYQIQEDMANNNNNVSSQSCSNNNFNQNNNNNNNTISQSNNNSKSYSTNNNINQNNNNNNSLNEEMRSKTQTQTLSNTLLDEELQKSEFRNNRDTINEEEYFYYQQHKEEGGKLSSPNIKKQFKKNKNQKNNRSFNNLVLQEKLNNNQQQINIYLNSPTLQQQQQKRKVKSSIRLHQPQNQLNLQKKEYINIQSPKNNNKNCSSPNNNLLFNSNNNNNNSNSIGFQNLNIIKKNNNNNLGNSKILNKSNSTIIIQQQQSPQTPNENNNLSNNFYQQLPDDPGAKQKQQSSQFSKFNYKKLICQVVIFLSLITAVFCLVYFLGGASQINNNNGSSDDNTPSTICPQNQFHLHQQCVSQCPTSYYANKNTYDCILCNQQCRTCANGSQNTDCTSCENGYYLLIIDQKMMTGICVRQCPGSAQCKVCIFNCTSCTNDQMRCAQCAVNTYLFMGFCLSQCPAPYQIDRLTGTCKINITQVYNNTLNNNSDYEQYFGYLEKEGKGKNSHQKNKILGSEQQFHFREEKGQLKNKKE